MPVFHPVLTKLMIILLKFNYTWDCELHEGMRLEILDKTDYDVYECEVTRLEDGRIWIKRDDRNSEEIVDDIVLLQTPSEEDDEDEEFYKNDEEESDEFDSN